MMVKAISDQQASMNVNEKDTSKLSMEELACIQVLQNLEARYVNEAIGWTLIVLTIILIWIELSRKAGVIGSIIFAPTLFFAFTGLLSAYLSSRLVSAIPGHTALPILSTLTLRLEVNSKNDGCYCGGPVNLVGEDYLRDLENRARNPLVKCINIEIRRHIEKLYQTEKIDRRTSKTIVSSEHTAARIHLAIQQSGLHALLTLKPYKNFMYVVSVAIAILVLVELRVLTFQILSWLKPPIAIALTPYVAYIVIVIVVLLLLLLYKKNVIQRSPCRSIGEISEAVSQGNLESIVSDIKPYIGINKTNDAKKKILCALGLDKASKCCLAGHMHYCGVSGSLSPTLVLSLLMTIAVYTIITATS